MNTLQAAVDYHRRGWCSIPIPARSKNPNRTGWQHERWKEGDLPREFGGAGNIGVLLGEPSAGLVDIDLDCDEVIALADGFLPDTEAVFGRSGKRNSHRLYVVDSAPPPSRLRDVDGTTLVELRSTGGQTVFPPSTHPSGESIEWESDGEPARVTPDELKSSVARLAAVALLVRHWPSQGSRHDVAMALAGGLAGAGFDRSYVTELVELIARAAGDDEIEDRRCAAESTFDRAGVPATGWPALGDILGDGAAAKAREWFGTCRSALAEVPARTAPAPKPKRADNSPELRPLDVVRVVPLRWLWDGRLPQGKLTLLSGDPGLGKSLASLDIAARVSAGVSWPDQRGESSPAGGVILMSAEDDLADTTVPRLIAAGADLGRIVALEGVYRGKADEEPKHFNMQHNLPALDIAIRQCPDCRLVVVDPVSAFLGDLDSHVNSAVRGVLAPLSRLAGKHDVAILCVSHLNKAAGSPAVYRTMGSLAFVAAVRAAWCVTKDKDDPLRRLVLPVKVNLSREPTGLAYRVQSAPMNPDVGVVAWEPEPIVGADVDEALAPSRKHKASVVECSTEWLEEQLAGGPLPMREIERRARDAGYSWASVRRAQYALGIEPQKDGFGEGWRWGLPSAKVLKVIPTPNKRLRLTDSECEGAQKTCAPSADSLLCEGAQEKTLSTFAKQAKNAKALKTFEHLRVSSQPAEGARAGVGMNVSTFVVPNGWTRTAWIEKLEQMASRCESQHPDKAAEYRGQAAAIRNEKGLDTISTM